MPSASAALGRSARKVPVVLQHERAECGLSCLAMIAGSYGKQVNLASLRQQCRLSGHGATFQELVVVAARLKLIARPVRLAMSEIPALRLPAILHWRMNHFVVLVGTRRRHFEINDPAVGRRLVSRAEFDESFTGVALEVSRHRDFRKSSEKWQPGIADFLTSFRNLYRYLGVIFSLLLVIQLLALVPSVATQIIIDEVVLGQDRAWLFRALGGLAIVMLARTLLDGLRGWIGLYTGTRLAVDSTVSIVNHLFALPTTFICRRHLGDLMSKLESLTPIRLAITEHGINAMVQLLVLVTTLLIMLLYSPWLAFVSIAGLSISLATIVLLLPYDRRLNEQALVHQAAQNTSLLESLRACETVSGLGLRETRRLHWQNSFINASNARLAQGKIAIVRSAVRGVANTAEQLGFLAIGVAGILDNEITIGVMFAFVVLRGRFGAAALTLATLLQHFALLRVHTGRLGDIVLAPQVAESCPGAVTAEVVGSLSATSLAFSYNSGAPIIEALNCDITAGSTAVITGPSGRGKTTLLKILAGQLNCNSGQVFIDGIELSLWDQHVLGAQCAIVMQNDYLFQGSIAENIASFSATPDLSRVRDAALCAEIWTDIQKLPMQTETLIGDSGVGLSGGQIQRLALARALYRRPRMLFLDEATSHLDVEVEKRVLQNIAGLNITVVSVAHRPDAIALAGQVISLDHC